MTIASVRTALETAVLAGTTATAAIAAPLSRREQIPAGSTYMKTLAVAIGQTGDSNVNYLVGSFAVTMLHKLSDATDENTYLVGNALTDQAAIMVPSFYRAVAGVHEVIDTPELALPTRIGNVIEYTVTVQLSITA